VDFPRGGAGTLTALEIRDVRHQAKQDVLFDEVRYLSVPWYLWYFIYLQPQHELAATPKRTTKKQVKDKVPLSQKGTMPSFKRATVHEFPSMKVWRYKE